MLTVKQVAERLSISRSLAYRMIRSGEIPSYRIANCRRVSEEDLQKYLKQAQERKTTELPSATGRHF
jgi:excisionase family DNA binding protein